MKKYISYEEGSNGAFTHEEIQKLYKEEVNKKEYPDFEIWLHDMLKSGVFETIRHETIILRRRFPAWHYITLNQQQPAE